MDITHKITKQPHLLFVGQNGHNTYGIEVKHLDEKNAKLGGYQVEFIINDHTLTTHRPEYFLFLGESLEFIKDLQAKIKIMQQEQP